MKYLLKCTYSKVAQLSTGFYICLNNSSSGFAQASTGGVVICNTWRY